MPGAVHHLAGRNVTPDPSWVCGSIWWQPHTGQCYFNQGHHNWGYQRLRSDCHSVPQMPDGQIIQYEHDGAFLQEQVRWMLGMYNTQECSRVKFLILTNGAFISRLWPDCCQPWWTDPISTSEARATDCESRRPEGRRPLCSDRSALLWGKNILYNFYSHHHCLMVCIQKGLCNVVDCLWCRCSTDADADPLHRSYPWTAGAAAAARNPIWCHHIYRWIEEFCRPGEGLHGAK